MSKAEVHP